MKTAKGLPRSFFLALLGSVFLLFLASFWALHSVQAAPGTYKTINFQGKVTNPNGTNVTDGTYQFVFRLYTVSSGGSATWTETVNLAVDDGIFQHNLGSTTALPGSVDFNTDNIYLDITFNSDPAGEMTPRIRFTSSPYAFNADMLDGLDSSALVQLSPGSPQTGNIDITGNGTFGGTLSVTGNAAFDTNVLFVNASTNRVGVGNSGPSYTLDVTGDLRSTRYIMGTGPDLSLIPVVGGQSVMTTWWGLQLVGNRQATVDYTPTNYGAAGDFSVIIPNQQAAAIGLVIQAHASQSGDLLRIRNSSSLALAGFNSTGQLYVGRASGLNGSALFYNSSNANTVTLSAPTATGARALTLPDESGTLCSTGSVCTGYASTTGVVLLSPGSPQTGFISVTGNISSGATIAATTSLQAPLLDTASAAVLSIGTTNATSITLQKNTTVAATRTFTVTSGATSLTGATTGDAFTLSNSTSTGNVAVFRDNATTVFSVADGGAALFQNSADSPTGFQILRQGGGTLFLADTQNTVIKVATTAATTLSGVALFTTNGEFTTTLRVGNATDGAEFNGSTGPVYRGTARPTRRVNLLAEYAGATLTGDGSNNSGTMTTDFCSGTGRKSVLTTLCGTNDEHSFYQWRSTSGTNDYDIFIRYQMPSDMDTGSITAINMFGYRTTVNDIVTLGLFNASNGQCGTTTTITTTNTTWTETALAGTGADADCTAIAPGDIVVFRIKVTSSGSSNNALAAAIRFDYRSRF